MSPCRGLAARVSHTGTSAAAGRRVVFLLPFLLTIISPHTDDWQTTNPAETNKRWEQGAERCQGSMLWNARQCVPRPHPLKICAEVTPLNNARWSPTRHDGVWWWWHHGPQPQQWHMWPGGKLTAGMTPHTLYAVVLQKFHPKVRNHGEGPC